jgi:hypothetical protein
MDKHPAFPSRVERLLYFTIYYEVPNRAFQIAAETWAPIMMKDVGFNPKRDILLMLPVTTEGDFKAAWKKIADRCRNDAAVVIEGHLFTHASWLGLRRTGLEFKKDGVDDATVTEAEIKALEPLNWHPSFGKLTLEGCNTGEKSVRGWCPAEAFAKRQGVTTEGQAGWGYFSSTLMVYTEIAQSPAKEVLSDRIYLWAYNRGVRNNIVGDGTRMPGILYHP